MWKNVVLTVVSVVVAVLLADLVLRHPRLVLHFAQAPSYYYNRFPAIHKTLRHSPNVNLYASVSGDLANMLGGKKNKRKIWFITDELGFRNTSHHKKDVFNTILLGDSFGFCEQTDQMGLLSAQLNNAGHRVYNISTAGINLWDEAVTLQYVVKKEKLHTGEKTHILWLIYEGNDLDGEFFDEHDPDRLVNSTYKQIAVVLDNYYKRSIIRLSVERLKQKFARRHAPSNSPVLINPFFGKEMLFFKPHVVMQKTTLNDIYNHSNSHQIQETFKAMAAFVNSQGFSLTCVVIPTKERVYEWVLNSHPLWTSDLRKSAFSRYFNELCKFNGFNFIDLTPHLISASKTVYENNGETVYWLDDTHWNDVGQKIAATVINKRLNGVRVSTDDIP